MSRDRKKPVRERPAGRVKQKLRTRTELLMAARQLLQEGAQPTVQAVADAAQISRRTAYRYFPTQAKMLSEAALEGLRPAMEAAIEGRGPRGELLDAEQRVDMMISSMMKLAVENEALLRTMIHQTVLEPVNQSVPKRGTRRIDWIETALEPLRAQLGKATFDRLVSALALCTGIEALIILRDVRGLSVTAATQVSQWMGRAILKEALADVRVDRASRSRDK